MAIHLVWYRNDLRTNDHRPLSGAVDSARRQDGDGVLPVYIVDPSWFGRTSFGFDRVGPHRLKFLRQCLADLQDRIAALGGRMAVVPGRTVATLTELMRDLPVASLHLTEEVSPQEMVLQRRVVRAAEAAGVSVHIAPPAMLMPPESLPFEIKDTPEVFSKYRRIVEKDADHGVPIDAPERIPAIVPEHWSRVGDKPIEQIEALRGDEMPRDDRAAIEMTGGETAGLRRLEQYVWQTDSIATYKQTRNGMIGPDYSSKFSAWLAHGCLSARQIAAEVHRYESERTKNDSTYWMIFELLWRDYFALMTAKHGGRMFQVTGLRGEDLPWTEDADRFEAWTDGRTGFPLIDANMRELKLTGFMSNRGRQNVGSFLTKNLGINWLMGAEWFEKYLIDYDSCSNYGNWNYVAGVGNDARGFRFFNTIKQSRDYDPDGDYVRLWCPELQDVPTKFVHEPWKMQTAQQKRSSCIIGVDYPAPVVDLMKSADHNRQLYEQSVGHDPDDRSGGGKSGGRSGRHRGGGGHGGKRNRSRRRR